MAKYKITLNNVLYEVEVIAGKANIVGESPADDLPEIAVAAAPKAAAAAPAAAAAAAAAAPAAAYTDEKISRIRKVTAAIHI